MLNPFMSSKTNICSQIPSIPAASGVLAENALEAQRPDRTGFPMFRLRKPRLEPLVTKDVHPAPCYFQKLLGLQTSLLTLFSMLESSKTWNGHSHQWTGTIWILKDVHPTPANFQKLLACKQSLLHIIFNALSHQDMKLGTATNGIPFVAGTLSLAAALEAQRPDRTDWNHWLLKDVHSAPCYFQKLLACKHHWSPDFQCLSHQDIERAQPPMDDMLKAKDHRKPLNSSYGNLKMRRS
nr:hypothetical protein Iba_chr09aCG0600 [Ipomoea batatas]